MSTVSRLRSRQAPLSGPVRKQAYHEVPPGRFSGSFPTPKRHRAMPAHGRASLARILMSWQTGKRERWQDAVGGGGDASRVHQGSMIVPTRCGHLRAAPERRWRTWLASCEAGLLVPGLENLSWPGFLSFTSYSVGICPSAVSIFPVALTLQPGEPNKNPTLATSTTCRASGHVRHDMKNRHVRQGIR